MAAEVEITLPVPQVEPQEPLIESPPPPTPQQIQQGITFWTNHTLPVLTSLLTSLPYTPEQQQSHLNFLSEYIVPTMGLAPSPQKSKSLLTPNGSPFETSLNHSDNGKSTLRFCYEPVFPPHDGVTSNPILKIAHHLGADLRWFNEFAKAFYPSKEDEVKLLEIMPKTTIRIPKVFLAFDLEGDKQVMKAYFYPVIKHMTSGLNSDRAVFELIRRLDTGFGHALDVIEGYEKRLYGEKPLSVVVGIDCVKPGDGARVKIYIEPRSNCWGSVQEHVTLGGKLRDGTTLEGLAILRDMWNLMINEPEEKEIDPVWEKEVEETMPKSSGACFSWELRPGQEVPETKIYLSLRQFFKTDKGIVEAIEKVFRKRGWAWGVEGAYKKVVSDAYGSDVLDDEIETPTVHTFVSFNFSEKKGAYMTTYVAPFVRFP